MFSADLLLTGKLCLKTCWICIEAQPPLGTGRGARPQRGRRSGGWVGGFGVRPPRPVMAGVKAGVGVPDAGKLAWKLPGRARGPGSALG